MTSLCVRFFVGIPDVNGLHTATIDSAFPNGRYVFLARPGQIGVVEQRAISSYQYVEPDDQSPILFNTENDTIEVYKLMADFPIFWAIEYASKSGGVNIGTRRFGNNDLNAPAFWNLNYMAPDSLRRAWTFDVINDFQTIPHVFLAMQYQEGTEIPTVPFIGIAIDPSFPSPGTNATSFIPNTHEITHGSASYPPWPSEYTTKIEIYQAIGDSDDWLGADPVILEMVNDKIVLNDRGRRIFSLMYLADPKTKL